MLSTTPLFILPDLCSNGKLRVSTAHGARLLGESGGGAETGASYRRPPRGADVYSLMGLVLFSLSIQAFKSNVVCALHNQHFEVLFEPGIRRRGIVTLSEVFQNVRSPIYGTRWTGIVNALDWHFARQSKWWMSLVLCACMEEA